jgi:hypothetical protein
MLPGFRSLFIAVVLSVSMLVFGLGAAALLRATHEEFASLPLQRIPEVVFATREDTAPTLAMLQVDPPPADISPTDIPPTALDRHDGSSDAIAATHEAPTAIAPATPEATTASDPGTATDTVAALSVQPQTADKPAINSAIDMTPPEEKTAATPPPDGNSAGPVAVAPSTPATPKPDAAIADEATSTPATDPVRSSPNETQAGETQASETQTVASLDPATPVSAAPESNGQTVMDAAPASTPSDDSKPDDAKVDNTKSDDTKPDDAKAENTATDHSQADSATIGTAPAIAEPSAATTVAALENGINETTGRVTNEPPVSVETKAAIPDIVPQTAPADAANRGARNDAPVVTALNIHIPMPVARPKALGKITATARSVMRKHIAKQRPVVRRARIVRPAPPKPADPFAGTPFGSN